MEVAASGVAVASIAIQLLDSTNTISTFIRRVKDASQELLRLAGLLDRLGGVLQVVMDVLDQQASLQDELLPVPESVTRCLQRCKQTLAPLHEMVIRSSKMQTSSRLRRLQADVRAAFKAGEMRSLEDRLQQEIDILSLALMANGTRIQLHMYTVLHPKQSASLKTSLPAAQALRTSHGGEAGLDFNHRQSVSRSIATSFYPLHIRNIRSKRILSKAFSSCRRDGSVNDCVLTEENEYFVSIPFVRWGILMSQQTQLGPIFPALRVYPIIDDIHRLYSNKMCTWNVQTFQMDMHSGLVHPFTRDRHHNSLLHLAASRRRPDIYGLLLAYGVKPDHGKHGGVWDSISGYEILNAPAKPYESLTIDTYRLLWADYEGSPQLLDYIREGGPCWTEELRWSSVGVWLFQQSPTQLYGLELTEFQHAVLRGMLVNFIWDTNFEGLRWLGEIPRTSARILLAEEICNGSFGLLDRFFNDPRLVRPQTIGATIISALSILKIDIEACIMQELLQFPLGVIECTGGRLGKKITFTKQCTSGYTLDWVWIFDRFAPGYLLLQELPSLTVDSDCELPSHYGCLGGMCDGPFSANRHDRAKILPNTGEEKWPPRFESRRARKERKERARSGQKLTRPKMPGSWVF